MAEYTHKCADLVDELVSGNASFFDLAFIGQNSSTVAGLLSYVYGDMLYYTNLSDIFFASVAFGQKWSIYKTMMQAQFEKKYAAITATYNPLENYDRTEGKSGFTAYGEYTDTDTFTPTTTDTVTTTKGEYERKKKVATYDAAVKDTEQETEGHATGKNDTAETKHTGFDKTEKKHGTHRDDYSETLTVHGNIGVTSSQDMQRQELEIRSYNILADYLAGFARMTLNTDYGGCNPYANCVL